MALSPRPVGSNITRAFSQGLNEAPDLGSEFEPNDSYHLPAYTLSLKNLANLSGQNIDDVVKQAAWQCVAESENGDVVIGEVTTVHKAPRPAKQLFDGPVRMTSLSHGDVINSVYKRTKVLHSQHASGLQDDYEPRMLRIPGLLVTTIWLKSKTGGKDLVVPLHTKLPALTKEKEKEKEVYAMDEFLTAAREAAQERLKSEIYD